MNSQLKELKVDIWIKRKSLDIIEIFIATKTHLTHLSYLPNFNIIQSKYASNY